MTQNYFRRSTMFLYFNGCSYTKGGELDDRVGQRFSTLVSEHFNTDHLNDAAASSTNDTIVRTTFEFLENNRCDYGIIMMTHPERMEFNQKMMPSTNRPQCHAFYENYYDDNVGSLNFYKNRFLLEQEFDRRGIPLILLQYYNVHGDNTWSRRCKGTIPTVTRLSFLKREETILGTRKNGEYYYRESTQKTCCHFNYKGHRKIADYIIQIMNK